MINRALFKQSCKANWIKWLSVTLATCTMLAIVIIVLGNLGINDIRNSLKDVFTQADQESVLKENSVSSYELYISSTEACEQAVSSVDLFFDSYELAKSQAGAEIDDPVLTQIQTQIATSFASQFIILMGSSDMTEEELANNLVLLLKLYENNADVAKNTMLSNIKNNLQTVIPEKIELAAKEEELANGATEEEATASAIQAKTIASSAVTTYLNKSSQPSFVYSRESFTSDANYYVNMMMYNNVYQLQIASGVEEEDAIQYATAVKVIANTATTTYEFWLNEYKSQSETGQITEEQKQSAEALACQSISDQIPEKVAEALSELGNMDIYGLIIGSIFYRIAGLLLPMVFVIMTANGLLANQVDSGSMAYVLSTPTKRRTVTVTQLAYLIFALFSMFSILTVVSVISVWISGGNTFAINYGEILLLNAGAFLTMFAIAGFCFMCSALFNRTKYSLSIGGGLTIFFLVCTILGLFGSTVVPSAMRISAMDFFNYLSLITFFDTVSILGGTMAYLWKFGVLFAVGIVCIIIGIFRFDKKDLPL